MDKYLQTLGAPNGIITVAVWVLLIGACIKELKNLWDFFAPKFLGIQTNLSKEIKFRKQVADNNDKIAEFIESQTELNKNINKQINNLDKKIDTLSDDVGDLKIEEMKNKIVDFASSINAGRVFTREQYNSIKHLYDTYEEYMKRTGGTNEEVEISIEIINASYTYLMKHHAFVEDKLSDIRFQSFFQNNMDDDSDDDEDIKPKKKKKINKGAPIKSGLPKEVVEEMNLEK